MVSSQVGKIDITLRRLRGMLKPIGYFNILEVDRRIADALNELPDNEKFRRTHRSYYSAERNDHGSESTAAELRNGLFSLSLENTKQQLQSIVVKRARDLYSSCGKSCVNVITKVPTSGHFCP